jgi:hypothetical protein
MRECHRGKILRIENCLDDPKPVTIVLLEWVDELHGVLLNRPRGSTVWVQPTGGVMTPALNILPKIDQRK